MDGSNQSAPAAFDPLPFEEVAVDPDWIDAYEGNCRVQPNRAWAALKASTRRDGQVPGRLYVTRRPGSARLVLSRGGNTRLEVFKQLRSEHPEDPRFQSIRVTYEPFTGELAMAIHAWQENADHGELLYIEKAFALSRAFDLWVANTTEKDHSVMGFCRFYEASYGPAPERRTVTRMRFAVNTLYAVIPTALVDGGMTDWAVRRLLEYRRKLSDLWVDQGFGTAPEFDGYFFEHLRRQERELAADAEVIRDDPDARLPDSEIAIDYDKLTRSLVNEFARVDAVDVDEHHIAGWIDAALRGAPIEVPPEGSPDAEAIAELFRPEPEDVFAELDALEPYDTPDLREIRQARLAAAQSPSTSAMGAPGGCQTTSPTRPDGATPAGTEAPAASESSSPDPIPLSSKGCRDVAFHTARRIAERNGFAALVTAVPGGIGYVVSDIIVVGDDEPVPVAQAAPWWALVYCGLILELPAAVAEAHLPEESLLRGALAGGQTELIWQVMGSPARFGRYLAELSDLDDRDFQLLQKLARHILRSAGPAALWEPATAPAAATR